MKVGRALGMWLILMTVGMSCAPATRTVEPGSGPAPRSAAPKRLVASIFADPAGMHQELTNRGGVGSVPGMNELHHLLHAGLSVQDDLEIYRPWLAEEMPSIENGLWTVEPDGRMATTWRMKPGILWHDGTPFTTDSLTLALDINRDREIGIVTLPVLDQIEAVETPDPQTIIVRWARPFIEADQLFSQGFVMPIPAHVVQATYQEDKKSLFNLPYWREEYVGLGPFRLQEWVPGSALTLVANDRYVLGRPKLDQIEVRFIKEINTIVANLMAGSVEKHLGRGFGVEQLLQVRDAAPDMNVQVGGGLLSDAIPMFPQFIDTDPPIVTNLEFRRALLEAIDRQEMTDSLNYGLGPIAHTWLQPDRREFAAVESRIVRYELDPRRSAQTIERLGYSKGADGNFRTAQGEPLKLELRTTDQRLIQPRSAFSVADYWKRLGIDVTTNNVPNQLIPDREYRSTFPAFELVAGGITARSTSVFNWHSSSTPLPETRYVGGNRARYRNPEFDSFITRYVTTVPVSERLAALGDVIHYQTQNLTMMTLFYEGSVVLLGSKRLKGVTSQRVWNAHLWDLD